VEEIHRAVGLTLALVGGGAGGHLAPEDTEMVILGGWMGMQRSRGERIGSMHLGT
jgi:hypothetical protein